MSRSPNLPVNGNFMERGFYFLIMKHIAAYEFVKMSIFTICVTICKPVYHFSLLACEYLLISLPFTHIKYIQHGILYVKNVNFL